MWSGRLVHDQPGLHETLSFKEKFKKKKPKPIDDNKIKTEVLRNRLSLTNRK